MNEKKELEKTISVAQKALNRIKDNEWLEENKPLVGKCFKYRNSYGGDHKKWWFYCKVLSIKNHSKAGISFQDDKQGRLSFEQSNYMHVDGCIEITQGEFNRALRAFKKKLEKLT